MRLIQKQVPLDHNLFLFGDDHQGTDLRHDKGWEKLVTMMNSEYEGCSNNYGLDHGDIVEAILLDDHRYEEKINERSIIKQIKRAVKCRQEIKDKLICILEGNHPLKLWRIVEDITKTICQELGVLYGTWESKITYISTKGNQIYKHHARHGQKSITSTADDPKRARTNMELILKRQLKELAGDCVLHSCGHTHKLLLCRPIDRLYLTDDGKQVQQKVTGADYRAEFIHPDHRWFVNTGSFIKSRDTKGGFDANEDDLYSGYVERFGLPPVDLGFAVAVVRGGIIQDIILERV